jgi:hypothetical protein
VRVLSNASKGIQVHYATNNTYKDAEALISIFPAFFKACELVYIEPRYAATLLMEEYGVRRENYLQNYDEYRDEAFTLVNRIIDEATAEDRHYALILPDCGGDAFTKMFDSIEKKGCLSIFREDGVESPLIRLFPFTT